MPANLEPVLTLLLVAVLANLVVMGFVIIPPLIGRRSPFQPGRTTDPVERTAADHAAVSGDSPVETLPGTVPRRHLRPRRPDRQLGVHPRDVMIVAVTGLWPETQLAIFALLAFAGVFVLVVHDLLPPRSLGTAKFVVEGSVAITFATLLVLLTGAENSPFFFTFPLIVGGAALVVSPAGHVRARRGREPRLHLRDRGRRAPAPVDAGDGREGRDQPDRARPARLRRDGDRPRAARAPATRPIRLSTVDPLTGLFNRTFFFAAVEREIARSAAVEPRVLPADDGPRRAQADQRPLRPLLRRPGPARRRRGDPVRRPARSTPRPATAATSSSCCCPETDPTGAWVLAEKIRIGVAELEIQVAGAADPGRRSRSASSTSPTTARRPTS